MVNKDDLRALQALFKEINQEIIKERSLSVRRQNAFNSRTSMMQVMLDAEKGYFDCYIDFIDDVKESSDIEMHSDSKKDRDDFFSLRGLLDIRKEHGLREEKIASEELRETIRRKNKLLEKCEKLKKKIGI